MTRLISDFRLAYCFFIIFISCNILYSQSKALEALPSFRNWNNVTFTYKISPKFELSQFKTIIIAEILDEKNRESNNNYRSHASPMSFVMNGCFGSIAAVQLRPNSSI